MGLDFVTEFEFDDEDESLENLKKEFNTKEFY